MFDIITSEVSGIGQVSENNICLSGEVTDFRASLIRGFGPPCLHKYK